MSFYMKIDGLDGPVTQQNHQGWMQLESLDFGTHRDIHVQPGRVTSRETSLADIGDFVVTKHIDESSPHLFVHSCTGASLGTVIIHACHTSKESDPYLVYTFNNVMLSHYDISGSSPEAADMLMETLHLNFTQAQMKFVPRDANNNAQNPIIAGFDLEKATKM